MSKSATHSCSTVQGRAAGVGVGEGMLLVAIGCGCLPGILDIAARHPFVVFGTMEGEVFAGLTACVAGSTASTLPVYFYETG
ncbi:MAG: hypothetical protein OEW69_00570 [Nitrospirota bacterium]|nr:hypothetical protein [Nitrospirota bacterium]